MFNGMLPCVEAAGVLLAYAIKRKACIAMNATMLALSNHFSCRKKRNGMMCDDQEHTHQFLFIIIEYSLL